MALIDTGNSIGDISRMLQSELGNSFGSYTVPVQVTIERPQSDSSGTSKSNARLNLFLYEVQIDASLRNMPLTPGRPSPLWLVLRYLLTAFDTDGESDTAEAHDVLGRAMQALLSFNSNGMLPEQLTVASLIDNPEPLHVTFDDGTPDLLSRLMQGPDDKYRCSVPFQIRPILVANTDPPSSLTLVGIDYTQNITIGLAGVRNFVLPNMGPTITSVSPAQVQPGGMLTLAGNNLGVTPLVANFGPMVLPVSSQQGGNAQFLVSISGLDPALVSAGNIPVSVSQSLANGLSRSSNIVSVSLLPVLSSATPLNLSVQPTPTNPPVSVIVGSINLTGQFLGRALDYLEVGLFNEEGVVAMLDAKDPTFAPPPDQSSQQVLVQVMDAVPPGTYTAVCRVNGQQARQGFAVKLSL